MPKWTLCFALVGALAAACAHGNNETDDVPVNPVTSSAGSGGGQGGTAEQGGEAALGGSGGTPDSCEESPCKLTLPQCGCAGGEACSMQAGQRVCAPEGTAGPAEACGSCKAGLQCLTVASSLSICHQFCDSDADCTAGPGSACALSVDGSGQHFCSVNCDPVSSAGCPAANSKCVGMAHPDQIGVTITQCVPAGTKLQGEICNGDLDCADGYGCFNTGGTDPVCLRYCDTGPGYCPEGSCVSLNPPMVVGAITYGACL